MPIERLSDRMRIPRLGIIHLGVKLQKKNAKGEDVEYPSATDHFVFKDDVLTAKYGQDCKSLPIMFPVNDPEVFASQFYRAYSTTRGLICRGDGVEANRVTDLDTGGMATAKTKPDRIGMVPIECAGRDCPEYQAKKCGEVMCLQFLLPEIPGIGIWQINTGSINSIVNINSVVGVISGWRQRLSGSPSIALVPLLLTLESQEVISPNDGKKKRVHVLNLRTTDTIGQFLVKAATPIPELGTRLMLPAPSGDAEVFDADSEIAQPGNRYGIPVRHILKPESLAQTKKDTELFEDLKSAAAPPAIVETAGQSENQRRMAEAAKREVAIEQQAQDTKPVTNLKELSEWALAHGKQYTQTWMKKNSGIDPEKDPVGCYKDLKSVMGW